MVEAGLEPGTIYPILVAFEGVGWLSSREEDEVEPHVVGRPRRRYSRLLRLQVAAPVPSRHPAGEVRRS